MKRQMAFIAVFGALMLLMFGAPAEAQGPQPMHSDPYWLAQYWNNKYLNGDPVLSVSETKIDHDWDGGSPGAGIEDNAFSARWSRYVDLPAGTYAFTVVTDDGMRFFIDGAKVFDQWHDQAPATYTWNQSIAAGHHLFVVEYYENADRAVAKFSFSPDLAAPVTHWDGAYFNSSDLSGTPVLYRDDPAIDFHWGDASPAPALVNADNFSVRWTRNAEFGGGMYRFTLELDDGMRLWVNNHLLFDEWFDQGVHSNTIDFYVPAGSIPVKLEYYEHTGGAFAGLSWAPVTAITNWRGEYYNNMTLAGDPALVRDDAALFFNWGTGSPASGTVNSDQFSVRWTRNAEFGGGMYRFTLELDDGMRLWVNNHLLFDEWFDQGVHTHTIDFYVPAGSIPLKLEYYEHTGGAFASLSWAPVTAITNWRGEYYNNMTLAGDPALVRDDAAVFFNWGSGSPAPGTVNSDQFSARWTRNVQFAAGTYQFWVAADDGARLWVNDHLLIDQWRDQAVTTFGGEIYLPAGSWPVKLEYYEHGGSAVANLSWNLKDESPPETAAALVDDGGAAFQTGGSATGWHIEYRGFGGHLSWTWNNDRVRTGYNWARWFPDLAAGRYEVFAHVPAGTNLTANARYWVSHAGGFTLRAINQNGGVTRWVSLGTYNFRGTSMDYVSLSDVTYEARFAKHVVFDAVKWEPR